MSSREKAALTVCFAHVHTLRLSLVPLYFYISTGGAAGGGGTATNIWNVAHQGVSWLVLPTRLLLLAALLSEATIAR